MGRCMWELEAQVWEEHMFSDSLLFLQKNLLINLNRREASNLPGMAVGLRVGFLCLAVIDGGPCRSASAHRASWRGGGQARAQAGSQGPWERGPEGGEGWCLEYSGPAGGS